MTAAVRCELEEAKSMTLEGLTQSHSALEVLKQECARVGDLIVADMIAGAMAIPDAVEGIHQFITFEQEVVELFDVDVATVAYEDDTLQSAEQDMHDLLVDFSEKSEVTDCAGVAEIFGNQMISLLGRFQTLFPSLMQRVEAFGV